MADLAKNAGDVYGYPTLALPEDFGKEQTGIWRPLLNSLSFSRFHRRHELFEQFFRRFLATPVSFGSGSIDVCQFAKSLQGRFVPQIPIHISTSLDLACNAPARLLRWQRSELPIEGDSIFFCVVHRFHLHGAPVYPAYPLALLLSPGADSSSESYLRSFQNDCPHRAAPARGP